MDLRHGQNDLFQRVHVPAGDALQRLNHCTSGQDRIDGCMRLCRVPTDTGNVDREFIRCRHYSTRIKMKGPRFKFRRIVHGKHLSDVEPLHDAFLHHDLATAPVFFVRLEDQCNATREVACFGQIFGSPQQHRRMPVMAACVHFSRMRRRIFQISCFFHRQGIHICTQSDCRAVPLPVDNGDNTGFRDAFVHLVHTEFA